MTYQVSYCIYTAATVEALELKSNGLTPEERTQAAARLMAAVMILQNEASHTPGSGKSLDTIRRLLSEGPRPRANSQYQHPRRRKKMRFDSSEMSNTEWDRASTGLRVSTQRDHNAGNMPSIPIERHGNRVVAHNSDVSAGAASAGVGGRFMNSLVSESVSQSNIGAVCEPLQQNGGNSLPVMSNASAGAGNWGANWDADLDLYWNTDTGAGFHPDSFSWGISDDFPRVPPPPPTHQAASAPISQPIWGPQGWVVSYSQ